jgi:hypothetical protein
MGGLSTPPLIRDGKISRESIDGQRSIAGLAIATGAARGMLPLPRNPQHACAVTRALLAFDDFSDLAQNLL